MIPTDPLGRHQTRLLSSSIKTQTAVLDIMAQCLTDVAPDDARRAAQLAQQIGTASRICFSEIESILGAPHRALRGALVSLNIAEAQVEQLTSYIARLGDAAKSSIECLRLVPASQIRSLHQGPRDSYRTDQYSWPYYKAAAELLQPLSNTSEHEVDAGPQDMSILRPSKDSSSPMFVHYTISEDQTGTDKSIVSARLAALGARSERQFHIRPIHGM